MKINVTGKNLSKLGLLIAIIYILYESVIDFYNIASGTGVWWGDFSLKWAVIFLGFVAFCLSFLLIFGLAIWGNPTLSAYALRIAEMRDRLGLLRWIFVIIVLALPIWLLQYSYWGIILDNTNVRLLIWCIIVLLLTCLMTNDPLRPWNWLALLMSLFLTSATFSLAASFKAVSDYPFSLGWSEGNRMWDYSLLFGSGLYTYAPDNPPAAYLDLGRQLNGGLPFLYSHVTILQERLWLALMTIVPYMLLGWSAFRLPGVKSKLLPILAGLWAWMFLSQGPIHAPLLWSAVLVALAWGSSMWFAIPLIVISAYITTISRSTWVFAPAMWAGMLELSSIPLKQVRSDSQAWARATAVVLAGLAGGPFSSKLVGLGQWLLSFFRHNAVLGGIPSISPASVIISAVTSAMTHQPLLWYRLLPNATYGNGILLGLLIAAAPLIIVLVHLYVSGHWTLDIWQRLAIIFPLIAFLGVGLIVSTKIGGGGDLHNMDMFLIGVMFTAALAWRARGVEWGGAAEGFPGWIRIIIPFTIVIFGFVPLMNLRPLTFAGDLGRLAMLADAKSPKALGFLPSDILTQSTLQMISKYVRESQAHGEILFMDQRQLLTFGYIQDVTLVPEYEKKEMMDMALSSDRDYFERFYKDLAGHRFSLIISDPLRAPIKDSDYQFGEENNAWVKWVAIPVLCYYEPVETKPDFRLQLLVPKESTSDCSQILP